MSFHHSTPVVQKLALVFRSLFLCCACVCVLSFPAPAADSSPDTQPAASQDRAQDEFSVGLGGNIETSPYKNYDAQLMPLPIVGYEGEYAYVRGFNAGVKVINLPFLEFSAFAGFDATYFDASETTNKALRRLKDRNPSAIAGLEARLLSPYGMLHASGARDVLGQSNGYTGAIGYMYSWEHGPVEVVPAAGVYWNDSEYNDYYYGVSANEARKSGLDAYSGKAGFSPYLGLTVDYSITDKWEVFCRGEHVLLSKAITDSPMVGKKYTQSLTLGITHNF